MSNNESTDGAMDDLMECLNNGSTKESPSESSVEMTDGSTDGKN